MHGIFDDEFQRAVAPLRVSGAGTEAVGPLLSMLVNLVRPRRVLEVGMGYTTPFLAAALASAREQARAESAALSAKTGRALDGGELDDAWLFADPPLAAPGFHLTPYEPRLVALDNLSIAGSSAGRVTEVLARLGLDDLVTVVNADLTDAPTALPPDVAPFDFAWVDAYECLWFFDHLWDWIDPDGGLVVMHYLMTYPEGEAVLRYFRRFQQAHPDEMEILNLLEPHKLMQNSVTLLRRTSGSSGRRASLGRAGHASYTDELRESAAAHLEMSRPAASRSSAASVSAER